MKLAKHRAAHALFRSEHVKEMNQQVKENFVGNLPVGRDGHFALSIRRPLPGHSQTPCVVLLFQMLHADTHALTSLRTPEPNDDGVHSVWAASRVVLNMASFMECMFE